MSLYVSCLLPTVEQNEAIEVIVTSRAKKSNAAVYGVSSRMPLHTRGIVCVHHILASMKLEFNILILHVM